MKKGKRLLKLFSVAGIGFFLGLTVLIPNVNNSMQGVDVPVRFVEDTLRGAADTLFFPGPDNTDYWDIQGYQYFSFTTFYDTSGNAFTNAKKPKFTVEWRLQTYKGKQVIVNGQTTPWVEAEDSVLYIDYANEYTITPPPSWKIQLIVFYGDASASASRAINVLGEFVSIK